MKIVDRFFKKFGYVKQVKRNQYKKIVYVNHENPDLFQERLLHLTTQGNEFGRNKTEKDYQVLGMFFTIMLLIEYKLADLLKCIDENIDSKMLGQKIDVFKDFLKIYEWQEDEDIKEYRSLLQPLVEINKLRNKLAHDLTKVGISRTELNATKAYMQKRRPDLYEKVKDCTDEQALCIGLLSIFGFIFSFEIAKLSIEIHR